MLWQKASYRRLVPPWHFFTVFSKGFHSEGERYGNQSGAFGYFSLSEV